MNDQDEQRAELLLQRFRAAEVLRKTEIDRRLDEMVCSLAGARVRSFKPDRLEETAPMKTYTVQLEQSGDLVRSIAPLLSGKPAGIVGAALADLVAMLLAGHIVEGDSEETARIRSELLQLHVDTVEKLIPINHDMIHGRRAL